MSDVLHELFDELVREFRIVYDVVDIPPDRSTLVDLDSSTSAMFNRHWILPDARDAGIFVRGFVSRLMEERSNGALRSRGRDLLADNLLVYADNNDANENDDDDDKGRRQTHFIGIGVYTSPLNELSIWLQFMFVCLYSKDGDFESFRDSLSWKDHAAVMAATLIVPTDAI
jgi:hypothetical protein